ncbi:MAG: hypothetical protein ACRD2F_13405, partial [Terriglobales bacterium]
MSRAGRAHLLTLAVTVLALALAAPAVTTRSFNMLHVTLRLQPDFAARSLRVTEILTLRPLRDDFQYFHLDCAGPVIDSVTANGRPVRENLAGGMLHLRLPAPVNARQTIALTIRYHVTPAAGMVFYPAELAHPRQATWLWTSGEPNDNHHWLPIYDHPDDKLTADFYITAPRGDWAIANGKLLGRRGLPHG